MGSQQLSANQKKEVKRTKTEAKSEAVSPDYATTYPILFLQQQIGNREVHRLLRTRVIQAKLRLSQPPDVYDKEADQAAEAVMRRMEVPRVSLAPGGALIQRQAGGESTGTALAESAGGET